MPRMPSWIIAIRPTAMIITVFAIMLAASTRMIPYEYRPLNFTALGALALFAGGRIGLLAGGAATMLALGVSDYYLYQTHDYSPAWINYLFFFGYAIIGWVGLRHTENLLRVGGVSFLASVLFYLVTNFLAWKGQAYPYEQTFAGLIQSYTMALPFFGGSLLGDVAFTGFLYSVHTALVHSRVPSESVVRRPSLTVSAV